MYATPFYALFVLSSLATAQPTGEAELVDRADGGKLPHFYHEIDLDEFADVHAGGDNTTELDKRTDITACAYNRFLRNPPCVTMSESRMQRVTSRIADQFWNSAHSGKNGDCAHHYATDGNNPTVGWDQYATNKDFTKSDCGTTANKNTIAGALQKRFRAQNNKVCGVNCFQMTHGGTWRGFITFSADTGHYPAVQYDCSMQSANQCTTGGKKDCKGTCKDSP